MPYQFTFDNGKCIQCGICGDSCPVNTLDFTRPYHRNVESTTTSESFTPDMTEYPVQVNKCIGCLICQEECPVSCITIIEVDEEPQYYPQQGPEDIKEPEAGAFGLSEYTKVRPTKFKSKDPWGREYVYRSKQRKSTTETWIGMDEEEGYKEDKDQ